AMMLPRPLAEEQHAEDDKAILRREPPTLPGLRRRPAGADHQPREGQHAALHQPTSLAQVQAREVGVFGFEAEGIVSRGAVCRQAKDEPWQGLIQMVARYRALH